MLDIAAGVSLTLLAAYSAVAAIVRRFSRGRVALAGVCVAAAVYQVARVLLDRASDADTALMWARVGCAAAFVLAAAVYQFAIKTFESSRHHDVIAVFVWIAGAQLALLSLTTGYVASGLREFTWGAFPVLHPATRLIAPLFFGGVLAATVFSVAPVARTEARDRIRRRLFLIALGIGSPALVNLLPAYGLDVYPFGWVPLLGALFIVATAVEKHGLPLSDEAALPAEEIIRTMRDLLLVSDRDGTIHFANNAACTFLGYSKEEIVGRRLEELLAPAAGGDSAPLRGWVRDREYVFRTRMGQPIELTLSYSPVTDRDGAVTGAVIIGRDLRDRKRYEWEARRAVTLLQSTLDSTADGILVIAHDGRVLTWNQRFADMWAVTAELMESEESDLIAQVVRQLVDPAAFVDSLAALNENPNDESVHVLQLKDGRRFEQYSIGRYLDEQPVRVWSFRDVTARLDAEDQIQFQAYHDALTHLPNRRLFLERLEASLAAAKRDGSAVALVFMDLDRFKAINDTLGHDVADALLVEIADRLRKCVRQTDTVARHGGDEFTIILPSVRQADDAARVAEKILDSVAAPAAIGAATIEISASIGIAVYPADGADIETLLRNADDAMYRAKEAGRNNYQLCTQQMKADAIERLTVQSRLRKAIDHDELVLAFEPQIALATGRVTGAEAIIRWKDPERGVVEPLEFLPDVEETRLIISLGEWALFSVCSQLRRWADAGVPPIRIGVNVALRHFQRRDLPPLVRRASDTSGIDPMRVELEIAEASVMRDLVLSVELLGALRDAGVSLAIDHFGSAYSSLASLRTMPVHAVKLDRSLIAGITASQADASIVAAIISVARPLAIRVTADGVDTREQSEFLRDHCCDEGEGAWFGAPLDAAALAALVTGGAGVMQAQLDRLPIAGA